MIKNKHSFGGEIFESIMVIGNGYDLECGLDSSFFDFFNNYVIAKHKGSLQIDGDGKCNIWYILMYHSFFCDDKHKLVTRINKSSPLWMDVEDFIRRVICPADRYDLALFIDAYGTVIPVLSGLSYLMVDINHFDKPDKKNQIDVLKNHFSYYKNDKIKDIHHYMFESLISFESDFCEYLSSEVEKNKGYLSNSSKLFEKLRKGITLKTYVLSFNYTTPLSKEELKGYCSDCIQHIHGDIDKKNAVIGYDSNMVKILDEKQLIFGKTYQRVFNEITTLDFPELVQARDIRFYGLSLGEADYSYYYYLFDAYDLVEGDISLKFYYKKLYDNELDNRNYKRKYLLAINQLINKYAERVDKKGVDGESLFTRLSIDKRIEIIDIDS